MILGVDIHQGQEPYLSKLISMGWRHLRLAMPWPYFEVAPGIWDFSWADAAVNTITKAGGEILAGFGGVPVWLTPPGTMTAELTGPLVDACLKIQSRYGLKLIQVECETTIPRWWVSRDPLQWAQQVLLPLLRALTPVATVLYPGTTLRGEKQSTYTEAVDHFKTIRDYITVNDSDLPVGKTLLSAHIYRQHGVDVVSDLVRFDRDIYPSITAAITETGFDAKQPSILWTGLLKPLLQALMAQLVPGYKLPEVGGEAEQLANYQQLMPALAQWTTHDFRVYVFHAFGTQSAILRADASPTPAALYLASLL